MMSGVVVASDVSNDRYSTGCCNNYKHITLRNVYITILQISLRHLLNIYIQLLDFLLLCYHTS